MSESSSADADGASGDADGDADGASRRPTRDTPRRETRPRAVQSDLSAPIDNVDVFGDVYGHQGAKLVLRNALRAGDQHVLLIGPPASGKSVFLESLETNLPGVEYWDSKALNSSKLADILAQDPPILLLDEFDRMGREVYDVLSTPMEHGRIQKGTATESYDRRIDTQIIAAMNETDRVPNNIMSRFGEPIRFEKYSESEYLEICEHTLIDEAEWIETPKQAREVAKTALDLTGETDPRRARRVAKLATSFKEVDQVAKALYDPEANVGDVSLAPTEIAATKEHVQRQRVAQIASREAADAVGRRFGREIEAESADEVKQEIEEAVEEAVAEGQAGD